MKKTILVSREGGESRVCLLVSGKLVNIDAEGPSASSLVGNIYKGRVSDISRGLNAAFVDIGVGKEGFLSINDIHPGLLANAGSNPRMGDILSPGQEILIQISRDAIGEKGAMLTTCVSLPGRYTVLIPSQERLGISRKLPEEERQRLREILEEVEIPEGFGVIVRTAGQSQSREELVSDLSSLSRLWDQIESRYIGSPCPALLVKEPGVAVRFLRDYLTLDVSEIVVDDLELHKEVMTFLDTVMPKLKGIVRLYQDKLPLFSRYSVERQVENMFVRDVVLPSGGRIVIDKTEALIAIDVNSGKAKENNIEELALRTNLEAAEEIATQLVLRDLGGLIVIDFIDMDHTPNRTKVFNRIRDCSKDDKAKLSFGKISQFGLMEMSRQRLRSGMLSRSTEQCKHCAGVGYHRTTSAEGMHIIRKVRELAVSGSADTISVAAPVPVANFLQNTLRPMLYRLEQEHQIRLVVQGEPGIHQATVQGMKDVSTVEVVEDKPLDWPATLNGKQVQEAPDAEAPSEVPEPAKAPSAEPAVKKAPRESSGRRGSRTQTRDDDRWDSAPSKRGGRDRQTGEQRKRDGELPAQKSKEVDSSKGPQRPPRETGDRRPAQRPAPQRQDQRDQSRHHVASAPSLEQRATAENGPEKETFLDSIIKKLLGLDRQ